MKLTIEHLIQTARSLSGQFGKYCEVVVYDVVNKDLDYAIVYIKNGHLSGRKLGDGCQEDRKRLLREAPDSLHDKTNYLTQGVNGTVLKSSTTYFRDDMGKVHYILDVNLDITGLTALEYELSSFLNCEKETKQEATINVADVLEDLLTQSTDYIGKPVAMMSKEEKISAVEFLNKAGAFLITRSGDRVAQHFGISKFTLYAYMGKDNPV